MQDEWSVFLVKLNKISYLFVSATVLKCTDIKLQNLRDTVKHPIIGAEMPCSKQCGQIAPRSSLIQVCTVCHSATDSNSYRLFRGVTYPSGPGCSIVVVLLFYVHGKHLRSCRDGQLT